MRDEMNLPQIDAFTQIAILEERLAAVTEERDRLRVEQVGRWISVDDWVPEVDITRSFYGLVTDGRRVFPAHRWLRQWNSATDEKWIVWSSTVGASEDLTRAITHWQPLPAPPSGAAPQIDAASEPEIDLDELCACAHRREYHSGGYGDCQSCDCDGFDDGPIVAKPHEVAPGPQEGSEK
jgi:hypothetical protein